jgi:hypothetical protein
MSVSDYVDKLRTKVAEGHRGQYDVGSSFNQRLVADGDFAGLEQLHDAALAEVLDGPEYDLVKITDISSFEDGVAQCLARARPHLGSDTAVRALYFEYIYDGMEWCKGDLFLCTKGVDEAEDWSSFFEQFIEGPNVFTYLSFDKLHAFESLGSYVAFEYVHAHFLAAAGRAWSRSDIVGIPFGFAAHDGPIVYLREHT